MIGVWLGLLGIAPMGDAAGGEPMPLLEHPVFQKHPSPEEIAKQVRQLKSTAPGVVEGILADFDLSIRSSLTLKCPTTAWEQRFHVLPSSRITPGYPRTRASLEHEIEELRKDPPPDTVLTPAERDARAEFLETHLDELALEDHPELGLVMMHVLAIGWEDWSTWDPQNERLNKARERFPDLHRINALYHLPTSPDKIGLLLTTLVVADVSPTFWNDACGLLRSIENEDVLQFYIDWALDPATSNDIRWKLWSEIQTVMDKGDRNFWEKYLDSDLPTLWYCAQKVFDRPVPKDPWPIPKGELHWSWLSKAQSDWNYDHERDPNVRRIIDLRRKIAEIRKRENPATGRISPEDVAEIQGLEAEIKQLEAQATQRERRERDPEGKNDR